MAGTNEPTDSPLVFASPLTPAVGIPRPPVPAELLDDDDHHPAETAATAEAAAPAEPGSGAPAPDSTAELEFVSLTALAELDTASFDGAPRRPIDLPDNCRNSLLPLLAERTRLWERLDHLHTEAGRFDRLSAKTSSRGQGVPYTELNEHDEPEVAVAAVGKAIDQLLVEMQTKSTEIDERSQRLLARRTKLGTGRHQREIGELRTDVDALRHRLRGMLDHAERAGSWATMHLDELIAANATTIKEVERNAALAEHAPWELARWAGWDPTDQQPTGDLRLGSFVEARSGETLAVPCVAPLVGSGRSLVIASDGEREHIAAAALLQS